MKVKGVDEDMIRKIAAQCGDFRLDNARREGHYTVFALRMAVPTSSGITRYRKRGFSGKWTFAVCYHGHKKFMEQLFRHNPQAIIRTCKAAYLGLDSFLEKAPAVAHENVGSQFNPISYGDACEC